MRRNFRFQLAVLALMLAAISIPLAAHAQCPIWTCAPPCVYPTSLDVVGQISGTPDSRGAFRVIIRDCDGSPCEGAVVRLEMNPDDIHICDYQGGDSVDCATNSIIKFTNAAGEAVFHVVGSAIRTSVPPIGTADLWVNGVKVRSYWAAAFDLDGGGVSVSDVSKWMQDWGSGLYFPRGDYDHDGKLTMADLTILLRVYGDGTSVEGCETYAPGAAYCW